MLTSGLQTRRASRELKNRAQLRYMQLTEQDGLRIGHRLVRGSSYHGSEELKI